ncbi:DUF3105 domain-containing protein [Microcella sp.]|uniref:DUF3105 domain-containing protein n=1 Tax=Microcella sp. TaxID=1913979 RepID=UPI003918EA67
MADDSTSADDLTIKQQREKRRAEKVAALKAKQAKEKRNQRLGIAGAIVGGVAVIAILVGIVVTSATPPIDPDTIEIEGLETFEGLEALHVQSAVEYDMTPPAGGPHNPTWLNCGIYEEEVPAEYAVHSLEHGAVWVTYDPEQVSGGDLDALRSAMPRSYMILSPFPGLEAPVVASAWGVQVALDGIDDPRLNEFIIKYRQSPDAPEPGALCSQALDGPGKIS